MAPSPHMPRATRLLGYTTDAVTALAAAPPRIRPREQPMSDLPSHVQGYRETMRARENDRASRAAEVRQGIEEKRRVVDERTARLRAMRLAKVSGTA